jgi:sugar phosphate isomerase/epimerase
MYLGMLADPRGDVIRELYYADSIGFDFIELSIEGPKYTIRDLEPKIPEMNKLKHDFGLFFTCHTPWGWNMGNPYKRIRDATVEEVIDAIGFAEKIGSKLVTVHMNTRFGLYDKKEIIRNMADSLHIICDRAEKSGIVITVENVDQGVEDMKAFFELEPRAKFHLDVGHANLSCNNGSNIYAFIEAFKDRLHHVHVHDNKGGHGSEGDLHLALGMGNIDWARVVNSLKGAGYNGTVTFEIFSKNRQYLETSRDIFKSFLGGWMKDPVEK